MTMRWEAPVAILVTILVTSLLVVTLARAGEVRIPNAMLGQWCFVEGEEGFIRESDYGECSVDGRLFIGRKSSGGHEVHCKTLSITRYGNALQVRSRCTTDFECWWTDTMRWQLIKNGTRLKSEFIKSTQNTPQRRC
jgi:hypothetical protein